MPARAAAIDVAKDSGMVCTRLPHDARAGRKVQKVWNVSARYDDILTLGDHLRCQGVERVALESTSDYWRTWFYLLEAAGLTVWLVNARDVKNVTGRPKTDKLDAIWLCKLNERGMLRPSFVPPAEIRDLRALTRLRGHLCPDRRNPYLIALRIQSVTQHHEEWLDNTAYHHRSSVNSARCRAGMLTCAYPTIVISDQ